MDAEQVTSIINAIIAFMVISVGSTITLFLWSRAESNNDRRTFQKIVAEDRKDVLQMIREIQEESKRFHGRMCAIEERNRK